MFVFNLLLMLERKTKWLCKRVKKEDKFAEVPKRFYLCTRNHEMMAG